MVKAIQVVDCYHEWKPIPTHLTIEAGGFWGCRWCGEVRPNIIQPGSPVRTKWVRKPWWKPAFMFDWDTQFWWGLGHQTRPKTYTGRLAKIVLEAEE